MIWRVVSFVLINPRWRSKISVFSTHVRCFMSSRKSVSSTSIVASSERCAMTNNRCGCRVSQVPAWHCQKVLTWCGTSIFWFIDGKSPSKSVFLSNIHQPSPRCPRLFYINHIITITYNLGKWLVCNLSKSHWNINNENKSSLFSPFSRPASVATARYTGINLGQGNRS